MPTINLKHCFFVFLLALMHMPASAQILLKADEEKLEVQVMLADNVKDTPLPAYCGHFMTDTVVRYKVMKVVHGFYLGNIILIHQKCLREAIENHLIKNHVTYIYKVKKVLQPDGDKTGKQTYEIVL